MKEIYKNLFVGNIDDYEIHVKNRIGWRIIHACKEPYHRNLLRYTGQGAPKNHPEYLIAERQNRLFCNLIDAPNPNYIPKDIIDKCLQFIDEAIKSDIKILVHCNQGESRSPGISLLYLATIGVIFNETYSQAKNDFLKLYPKFKPNKGIEGFLMRNWQYYMKN